MASPKDILVQTLEDSANQVDQTRVRDATQQLEEWRTQPGFFSTLQEIFLDPNLGEGIRFESIIYVKNNLDRYWRKTAKSAIIEEEKTVIRQRLLETLQFHLPHPWIVTNAYTIGRIARHDFPRFWPDLVPQLLQIVRHAFELEQNGEELWRIENALVGLSLVVKELASVKLGLAVSAFHQVAPEIFHFLGEAYEHTTRQWMETLPALSPTMKISAKILGIMRNLLVYGFEKSGDRTDIQAFFDIAVSRFQEFYQLYHNLQGPIQEEMLRHVSKLAKLFVTYASERPFEFLLMNASPVLINAFVQICQHEAPQFNLLSSETDEARLTLLGKIVIPGISTLRNVLHVMSDPRILEKERDKKRSEEVATVSSTLQAIFSHENVLELAILLLSHFLIIRTSDLEAWEETPEEWILEATGDVVTDQSGLRVEGEGLFMELVSNFKENMTTFIAGCVHDPDVMTPEQLIYRESVYNAVTLNALALYDSVDFDTWLTSLIPAELEYSGPHNALIRRRMALLIGEWVGTKCAESSRPIVYQQLHGLLTPTDPRNDIVVRMSAATALRKAVDEWNFKVEDFEPFLIAFLVGTPEEGDKGGLIGLMATVEQIESRMKLIGVVEVIVERTDRKITPFVPSIMGLLPYLWEQSKDQRIFRGSVLSVLKTLIGALGEASIDYHSFIVELIALGTDPSHQEEFIYLFEDALDLWEEAVKNAPTVVKEQEPVVSPLPNFMGLFPRAVACLQFGSENLKKVLKIIECYLILDPSGIMERYASHLFAAFAELIVDLKPEASRSVMGVIEIAIQGYSVDRYINDFLASGLFYRIVAAILDENENTIITSQYLNILARIALQNPELELNIIRGTLSSGEEVVSGFIERWAGPKFDNIGQAKSRKLNAMGLTALLSTNDPSVLANLGSIMNVWFNVLSEVRDSEGGDALIYWRDEAEDTLEDSTDFGGSYAPSAHDRRKRIFLQNDPVHNTNLLTFMKEHLVQVQLKVGGAEVFKEVCLKNVDDALVDQMNTLLI